MPWPRPPPLPPPLLLPWPRCCSCRVLDWKLKRKSALTPVFLPGLRPVGCWTPLLTLLLAVVFMALLSWDLAGPSAGPTASKLRRWDRLPCCELLDGLLVAPEGLVGSPRLGGLNCGLPSGFGWGAADEGTGLVGGRSGAVLIQHGPRRARCAAPALSRAEAAAWVSNPLSKAWLAGCLASSSELRSGWQANSAANSAVGCDQDCTMGGCAPRQGGRSFVPLWGMRKGPHLLVILADCSGAVALHRTSPAVHTHY